MRETNNSCKTGQAKEMICCEVITDLDGFWINVLITLSLGMKGRNWGKLEGGQEQVYVKNIQTKHASQCQKK